MAFLSFEQNDLRAVSDALDIAEDATGNFFRFSTAQWKTQAYDVKTLLSLKRNEICQHAFAMLNRGVRVTNDFDVKKKKGYFYLICLQDHLILKALKRDRDLGLLPLLVYIFTHELVHIVRFCNFYQRFEVSRRKREKEETVVHDLTFEILKNLRTPNLNYVLDSYRGHRVCDIVPA